MGLCKGTRLLARERQHLLAERQRLLLARGLLRERVSLPRRARAFSFGRSPCLAHTPILIYNPEESFQHTPNLSLAQRPFTHVGRGRGVPDSRLP